MLNTWEREALEAAAAESVARPVGMASSRKGSPTKAQQLAAGGATSIPASVAGQASTCMPRCANLLPLYCHLHSIPVFTTSLSHNVIGELTHLFAPAEQPAAAGYGLPTFGVARSSRLPVSSGGGDNGEIQPHTAQRHAKPQQSALQRLGLQQHSPPPLLLRRPSVPPGVPARPAISAVSPSAGQQPTAHENV